VSLQTRGSANLLFIDFSSYQTIVDQNLLISKLSGKGAILRAYGTDHNNRDSTFVDRVAMFKSVGIPTGAYYFATPTTDPAIDTSEIDAQCDQFIAVLELAYGTGHYGDFIPMLDIESWGTNFEHPMDYGITGTKLADWVVHFKDRFFTKTKRRLGFYSNRYFLTDATQGAMSSADLDKLKLMPLWLAEYDSYYPNNTIDTNAPADLGGWTTYVAWQSDGNYSASEWGLSQAKNEVDLNRIDSMDRLIPCPPPYNVSAIQTADNTITVKFDKPNITDYNGGDVYINGTWKVYIPKQTGTTQTVNVDVTAYADYSDLEIQVTAEDLTGDLGWSEKVYLNLKPTLAESELNNVPIAAQGTVLKKGTTAIAELSSIDGVSVSADTVETTTLDTVGGYRTFIGSLKDAGEVSISGHFVYSAHNSLMADFESGVSNSYTIEFPDKLTTTGTKWTFTAIVTAFSTGASLEDLIGFDATLKVSGKPTLSAPV
jgi:predicted secreted protein